MILYRNSEGYASPTEGAAYAHIEYEERKKRREERERLKKQESEEQAELIRQNPDYGEIICRCETITKAEVLAAIRNPLGVHTVTGVKYRCRTMMGRCQGGYCQMRVTDLIMKETGCKCEDIIYNKEGAYMFTGEVR